MILDTSALSCAPGHLWRPGWPCAVVRLAAVDFTAVRRIVPRRQSPFGCVVAVERALRVLRHRIGGAQVASRGDGLGRFHRRMNRQPTAPHGRRRLGARVPQFAFQLLGLAPDRTRAPPRLVEDALGLGAQTARFVRLRLDSLGPRFDFGFAVGDGLLGLGGFPQGGCRPPLGGLRRVEPRFGPSFAPLAFRVLPGQPARPPAAPSTAAPYCSGDRCSLPVSVFRSPRTTS